MGFVHSAGFCLENSLPFRGHDESEKPLNKGIYFSVLKLISENNPDIGKYTLGNAKKNNKLTAPSIQKEIIDCFAKEVTKMICEEIKDDVFGLLVDESSDVSMMEQMVVVVRYVDKLGVVKESLIGIAHVKNTVASTLKEVVVSLLANNKLSIDQVRGQGYDGASNMRGEFNGLKVLILRDNSSAHYIHCFAHQLQLVIVAVEKKHSGVKDFYEYLSMVVNTVSDSCKRKEAMLDAKKERVEQEILQVYNMILDMQIQELGDRFNELSTSLIENMSGLNPCDSFSKFDISNVVAFSEMYPNDFNKEERGCISGDLTVFVENVKEDDSFKKLDGICDLARVMVETGRHNTFPLVYRILKLALVLPVATVTVERCFSKMKLIKTDLRNRMGDEYLNNALICAVEKETFYKVKEEDVMTRFQAFKNRRLDYYVCV
ncbi:hypothetical protein L1987_65069 [Smallanthus sonchifolius]|uniref:Uncharacterized protein n=1 Tax=Smallanthus sonchifolius TaxID=185202 RepID=A0ACB9BTC8_9ASTR|nr:hypothetical protein L1987_65069 [Smallanthus sonchifolius]